MQISECLFKEKHGQAVMDILAVMDGGKFLHKVAEEPGQENLQQD